VVGRSSSLTFMRIVTPAQRTTWVNIHTVVHTQSWGKQKCRQRTGCVSTKGQNKGSEQRVRKPRTAAAVCQLHCKTPEPAAAQPKLSLNPTSPSHKHLTSSQALRQFCRKRCPVPGGTVMPYLEGSSWVPTVRASSSL
jgi:hypothetical protein